MGGSLRWLLAVPRVAGPVRSGATGPVSVTDAQGGPTPVPPWVTLVSQLYIWAGAHLPGIYLSFGNSETKGFCFARISGLWIPRFACGPTVCWVCSGQLLLLLLVLTWSGHGQGMGSPQNLILRAHGGGWPGVLLLTALPGVSLTPPDALSPLMHLFKYWVIVFSFWQRRTRAFNRSFVFSSCGSLAVTGH